MYVFKVVVRNACEDVIMIMILYIRKHRPWRCQHYNIPEHLSKHDHIYRTLQDVPFNC